MFGLSQSDIEYIINVIKCFSQVDSAIVYGSRAMGNYKLGSDVDLALKGDAVSEAIAWEISVQLNERSPLPYKFDVLAYSCLINQALKQHIDQCGKSLYENLKH